MLKATPKVHAPELAVVIPTRNRPVDLIRALESLKTEVWDGVECVVVDQSDLEQRADLKDFDFVRRIQLDKPGLPGARNVGIAATQAPVVVFFDDDVTILPGCLKAHLECYEDREVGGVVGRIAEAHILPNSRATENRILRNGRVLTNLWGERRRDIESLKGANMSFRRKALSAAGPFDEAYLGTALLEEADMSIRLKGLGWRLLFEPRAEVVHYATATGGVRVGSSVNTERWRFRNTGYYVARHRNWIALGATVITYSAIATQRSLRWRDPTVFSSLMGALGQGIRAGSR